MWLQSRWGRSLPRVEESSRLRPRELGRLLAAAEGYAVLDASGRQLGRVDRVRYERYTDRPDEIVVRSGWLWKRELVVPLDAIETVDRATSTVRLREDREAPGDYVRSPATHRKETHMLKRRKGEAASKGWGWAKVSSAIVAAIGGLAFWRKRKQSAPPPQ